MRTQEEILARIEEVKEDDIFGVMFTDLLAFLDWENAKQFLREEATEEHWKEVKEANTRENIVRIMDAYYDFAKEKAENKRGLSAWRSMCHYSVWLWLLEEDFIDPLQYSQYGIPNLDKIHEFLVREGVRENG